jgi:hypothetical protein
MVMRLGAGDEGIDAFEPVYETGFHQRIEGAIDLQRRAEALLTKLVEQGIALRGPLAASEFLEHARLVLRQHISCRHDPVPARLAPFTRRFHMRASAVLPR